MARAGKSRNDMQDNAKQTSIGVLQGSLTDSIDLYTSTRQAHWNVKGSHFRGLHLMFEEFYTQVEKDIDEVAERLVQLGGTATGTSQSVAAGTRLSAYPVELKAGLGHVSALLDRYVACAKTVREGIDEADEAGDAGTADLLTNVVQNLDKAIWMLEATATPTGEA